MLAQRLRRNGRRGSRRGQAGRLDAVDDGMERLVRELVARQRRALQQPPRGIAQPLPEARVARQGQEIARPGGLEERKFVQPLPDIARTPAAEHRELARGDVQVVEPPLARGHVAQPGAAGVH